MKKKIKLGKKLSLSKEKLSRLNEEQLSHFMGGRMALATTYTAGGGGTCSKNESSCCSEGSTSCCG
ncbi:class I lanthipeptide [Longitalea luteola]|uniref:class I lanthipeptide n=1 Tax=Longitalea luteola TaxID=2812563 RepID=UPI001A977A89|nr:class I lanthipeptide [Longitalea luteola]